MKPDRLATLGLAAALTACTPEKPVNPDAYAPYGFCQIAEDPWDRMSSEPEEMLADTPSFLFVPDPEVPIDMRVLEKLRVGFEKEANAQIAKVKAAGGYCNLPESSGPQAPKCAGGQFGDLICYDPDTRLGDDLVARVERRNAWMDSEYPEWNGRIEWTVDLGRAECAVVDYFDAETLDVNGAISSSSTELLAETAKRLNSVAVRWNALCAKAQGGLLDGSLQSTPLTGENLLVERGQILEDAINPDYFAVLAEGWHKYAVPNEEWTGALTEGQHRYMLGSDFLAESVLGSQGGFGCPVAENIAAKGLRRNDYGGYAYTCEPDDRRNGERLDGVVFPK